MAAINYNRQLPSWAPSWLTPDIIQETKVWLRLAVRCWTICVCHFPLFLASTHGIQCGCN